MCYLSGGSRQSEPARLARGPRGWASADLVFRWTALGLSYVSDGHCSAAEIRRECPSEDSHIPETRPRPKPAGLFRSREVGRKITDILISALLFAVLVELAYRYGTGRWIWNKRPSEGEPSLNGGPDHSDL